MLITKTRKLGVLIPLPKKALKIARQVRKKILKDNGGNSRGMCLDASHELQRKLTEAGFFCELCEGKFHLEEPEEKSVVHHYWIALNGAILDVTADQFNDEMDGIQMAAIVYGNIDRYEEKRRQRNKKCK